VAFGVFHHPVKAIDLFKDLILDEDRRLDAGKIIEVTIPHLSKNCKYLPVYKYLREIGVNSAETYQSGAYSVDRHVEQTPAHFSNTTYARQFVRTEKDKTAAEIIDTNPPEKAAIFLCFVHKDNFDPEVVREFLAENIDKMDGENSNYSTYFRKIACLYDYYVYGWSE